jgi:signal transduction histidine kinase
VRSSIALVAISWTVALAEPRVSLHGAGLAVTILLLLAVGSWAYWLIVPDGRWVDPAVLLCGLAGAVLTIVSPHSAALAFAAVAVIRAAQSWPVWWSAGFAVVIGIAYAIGHVAIDDVATWLLAGPAVIVTALLIGLVRKQNDQLLAEAQQVREERARSAALDERARIAREIHDVLAHSLAALSLQLDVADAMLESGKPEPAHTSVKRASQLAKEGIAETRRAVDALRGGTLPLPQLLETLAEGYRLDTGANATVQVTGEPTEPPADVALTLYRTAQEAITNIRKHAPGAVVDIGCAYAESEVTLSVGNGAAPSGERPLAQAGGGYGLIGLRERTELAGGSFTAGPDGDGWKVEVRIPT